MEMKAFMFEKLRTISRSLLLGAVHTQLDDMFMLAVDIPTSLEKCQNCQSTPVVGQSIPSRRCIYVENRTPHVNAAGKNSKTERS